MNFFLPNSSEFSPQSWYHDAACPSMSPHTNFRQRKSVSSNGSKKKLRSVKSCSTRSRTLDCLPSSKRASRTLRSGLARASRSTLPRPPWLQARAITMVSPVGPPEGPAGTHRVEIRLEGITQLVGAKVVATAAARISSKGGRRLMLAVACRPPVGLEVGAVVDMESVRQVIPKVAHMVLQELAAAPT